MTTTVHCFECNKLYPLQLDPTKCPICGSVNVEGISHDRLIKGMEAGLYNDIDFVKRKNAKR